MAESTELTPWRWVGRALSTTLLLTVGAWLIGGVFSLVSPMTGTIVVAIAALLFAAPWSISRIGGAGLASSLIAIIAGLGASIEGHRARVVTNAEVKPLASLVEWQPDDKEQDFVAARLPAPLHHEWKRKASISRKVSSGKNGTRTVNQTAVPLSGPDGAIVGFACGERGTDGPYVLSAARWLGSEPELCSEVIDLSVRKLNEAGLVVSGASRKRVVKVYETEAALRSDHDLAKVFTMPLCFFVIFFVFVLLFRRAGAESVD